MGPLSVVRGPLRKAADDGLWTTDKKQRTKDKGRWTHSGKTYDMDFGCC